MYCCIQSVAQFRRLRSNKAEENCFTLDSSYNHVFLTGNPVCQHAVVPVEDVVWMHSFMNDDSVPFERALFILRKKLFPLCMIHPLGLVVSAWSFLPYRSHHCSF